MPYAASVPMISATVAAPTAINVELSNASRISRRSHISRQYCKVGAKLMKGIQFDP